LGGVALWKEAQKAAYYASSNAYLTFAAITNPGAASSDNSFSGSQVAEERVQIDILRCIFGNPFRPSPPLPSAVLAWNDGTVRRIAEGIYEGRAFDRLPILADALLDAGCDNDDLIRHCRSEGPHVRGCWAIDTMLGKS
jgi:hypothetical protein